MHVSTSADVANGATEDIWNNIKTGLLKTTEEVCGTTMPHRWHRETWWWNEHVEKAIAANRKAFKAWKTDKGTRASYDAAKCSVRHAVHHAHQEASMICDLAAAIICDGKVPSDWEQSFIVCLYKGKGDALERGIYSDLKLTEQVMKVLERIVDGLIRQLVSIDDSQFGFVPGRGTSDAIFVVRQLQENYLAANKRLYMAFINLEKAFDRVPRKVIWWALRKLGVEEWIVRLVQGMYANARSHVRVGDGYSEGFEVKVGVHQGSVLSPLHHCA